MTIKTHNLKAQRAKTRVYFKGYYDEHKGDISKKRRARYASDPEYRKAAIERARKYREERNAAARPEDMHRYEYSSREAADAIGVTTNDLRTWRVREHYPEPYAWASRTYYTKQQVALLKKLAVFMDQYGPRVKAVDREKLEDLKALISANWEN